MALKAAKHLFFFIGVIACLVPHFVQGQAGERTVLMAGSYQVGESAGYLQSSKIDAAMSLITDALEGYSYISKRTIDSLAQAAQERGDTLLTYSSLAEDTKADIIVFARVNALHNILRTDLTLLRAGATTPFAEGHGYAFITYRDSKTNTPVADPALLKALQRAFSHALGDEKLFEGLPEPFNCKPTKTLAVGSVVFIDSLDSEALLFINKVENSYSIISEVAKKLSRHPALTVYDTDSRDSLYAQFRFYFPENYLPMSGKELDALFRAGVEYVLTGSLVNKGKNAHLSLILCQVERGSCREVRRKESIISEKNFSVFAVQEEAAKLALSMLNEETGVVMAGSPSKEKQPTKKKKQKKP